MPKNNVSSVYLLRSSHMLPFLNKFSEIGSPIDAGLNKVGLSSGMLDDPNGFVVEQAVWQFIGNTSIAEGIPELGYLVTESASLEDYGEFGRIIVSAPNLYQALIRFIENVGIQTNYAGYCVQEDDDYLWFCRPKIEEFDVGGWQVEQHVISLVIQLIQQFLGDSWKPHHINLQSHSTAAYEHHKPLQGVPFDSGCRVTSIPVLKSDLPSPSLWSPGALQTLTPNSIPTKMADALKQLMLQNYFGREIKQVNVAESVFMNERTLKRRLQNENTNFRLILAEVQYEKAIMLMRHGNHNVAEVSHELGFKHPNNFTRAFKAWCGVTPRQYNARHFSNSS